MKYFIGIAMGLLIIFNWSSIKSYFDKSISEQSGAISAPAADAKEPTALQEKTAPQTKPTTAQKQDLFKDFK